MSLNTMNAYKSFVSTGMARVASLIVIAALLFMYLNKYLFRAVL